MRSAGWAAIVFLGWAIAASGQSTEPPGGSGVESVLRRLNLDDKIGLIRGAEEPPSTNQGQAGFLPGDPAKGAPALRLADGPPGVLSRQASIAEPATIALAATFDTDLAFQNGAVIASEARRLGVDVVLQPFINLDRDVTSTRGYNTFGEDPMLTGAMGAAEIRGIQSRGVMAQAKHFVGYDTDGLNVRIDPQTLHEVYVAPFADAVRAGVSSIMCSYNRINGDWACGSAATLTGILRDELHFSGFVTSDWGAVHSERQLAAGMDMEMPGVLGRDNPLAGVLPSYFDISPAPHDPPKPRFDLMTKIFVGGMPEEPRSQAPDWEKAFPVNSNFANLSDGLKSRSVDTAMIDRAALRVLGQMDRFGLLSGGAARNTLPVLDEAQKRAVMRQTSAASAVLLKNADGALPLSEADRASLAMIGPGAAQLISIGKAGERSLGEIELQVSPYEAIARSSPGDDVVLSSADDMTGVPIPFGVWGPVEVGSRAAPARANGSSLDHTRSAGSALPPNETHVWRGPIAVKRPGLYWVYLQLLGARGEMFLDGRRLAGSQSFRGALHGDTVQPNQDSLLPTTDGLDNVRAAVELDGAPHTLDVRVEADGSGTPEQVRLNWSPPEARAAVRAAAIAAAAKARKVVVFAWSRNNPAFHLPGDQDALIHEIAKVNPNIVVVLNTSQPVAMPWLDEVKAVLEMWWTGDEGGIATADILLGRQNPGGRLPFTWAERVTDYPATDPEYPERSAQGVDGMTTFSEGVDVGYRWFERKAITPLFPFGFGLSYSSFAYGDLRASSASDGGYDLDFKVTNLSATPADEVCQAYIGAPPAAPRGVQFAKKALAGFVRVHLAAHETHEVRLHLEPRRFEYWSTADKAWRRAVDGRLLMVGGSSRDERLSTRLDGLSR